MVFAWMLYCTAVSALAALGAVALERALGALGRPTRWAWAGALGASVALPFALPALGRLRAPVAPVGGAADALLGELRVEDAPTAGDSLPRMLDAYLLPGWALASAALLVGAAVLLGALALRRRGWRRATVAGVPVLVSARTGPAVVGFLRGDVVLPEWALSWDDDRRRMMVEHEREHLRARDPLLLALAFLAAAALPWNAALWWQLRRLRLAVEVDCDARVLRRHADVRAYGLLLLEVGRVAASGRFPVVALTEPPSFLERRIRTMTRPALRRRLGRASLSAALCAGAFALAAALPAPAGGFPGGAASAPAPLLVAADTIPLRSDVVDVRDATDKPRLVNGEQVQRLLQNGYPPLLRDAGITGTVQVQMVIDETGAVAEAKALESPRPEFAEPAVAVMQQARFRPARRGGRPVAVRVQVPVHFALDQGSPDPRGAPPAPPEAPAAPGAPPAPDAAPAPDVPMAPEATAVPGAPPTRAAPPAAPASAVPSAAPSRPADAPDVASLDRKPRLSNADEVQQVLKESYPPVLREAGITGNAAVSFVVTTRGTPAEARLVSASRPEFGEPALAAVRAMRFTPGARDGVPTAARVQVPITFDLPAAPAAPEGQ
jgi:TonB family protein